MAPTASAAEHATFPQTFDVYRATIESIAVEIDSLGTRYPALENFDPERHARLDHLQILYEHRVERVTVQRGIRRELTVQPQPGGLYLYIDFHEDVGAQASSSGVFRGHFRNRDRRVNYVTKVGTANGDLDDRLWEVLREHGTISAGLR